MWHEFAHASHRDRRKAIRCFSEIQMSALPSNLILASAAAPPPVAPPAPRGAQWLSAQAAADRMGVTPRRIAQLCGKWSAAGTARRVQGRWEVREDADPQLARVLFPEAMSETFSWGRLTHAQRGELMRREAIVKGWGPAREAGFRAGLTVEKATIVYCERISAQGKVELTPTTLYSWHRAWRAEGVAGLVDKRWMASRRDEADPFLSETKRWFLMPNKRFSKRDCWLMAQVEANRQGWPVRSYGAVKRFLAQVPQSTAIMRREGAEAFTNECEPFGERDYSTIDSNGWWCADHHAFDDFVKGPNGKPCRPWLTAWMDCRSRYIVGYVIRCADPNSDTIIEAWRIAVLAHGVPHNALMDNGRDFKAHAFAGPGRRGSRKLHVDNNAPRVTSILEGLGVTKVLAKPYHPQSKPIERFFRTVKEKYSAWWATYTGGNPATKPESLADNLKAGKAPMLEVFDAAFSRWLETGYHQSHHQGDSMNMQTPAAVYAACMVEKRTTSREALDVLCLRPSKPTRVTQNGVRIDGLTYFDIDLVAKHLGRMVTLRIDPRDITQGVQVYEADTDRFICIAMPKRKLPWGASSQELREAHAEKSKVRRKVREYAEQVRPRANEDIMDTMLRARAIEARHQAGQSPPPDPNDGGMVLKPVRSSIDDQLPAIRRAKQAQQYRHAAGAETITSNDIAAAFARRPESPPTSTTSFMDLEAVFRGHGGQSPDARSEPAIDPFAELSAQLRGEP